MHLPWYGVRRRVIDAAKGIIDLSSQLLFWTINGGGDECKIGLKLSFPKAVVVVVDGGIDKQVLHGGPNEEEEETMVAS